MQVNKTTEINITAGGGYSVPIFSSNELVYISGTATLASNVTISPTAPPMGLSEGTKVSIVYNCPSIVFGNYTVTIFGRQLPNTLRLHKVLVEAYYDGAAWQVTFAADYDGLSAALQNYQMVYSDGTAAASVTANAGGVQTLRNPKISNEFAKTGDKMIFTIAGNINTATNVNLSFTLDNGTTVETLFSVAGLTFDGDFVYRGEIVCTDFSSGNYKITKIFNQNGVVPIVDTGANVAVNLCNASVAGKFTLYVYATENAPVGGEVTIYHINVERFLVA